MRVGSYAAETGDVVSLEERREGSVRRNPYPSGSEVRHFPERRKEVVRGILLGQPTRQDYRPLSEMTPEEMEREALGMAQFYSDFPDIANEMDRLNQLGRELGRRERTMGIARKYAKRIVEIRTREIEKEMAKKVRTVVNDMAKKMVEESQGKLIDEIVRDRIDGIALDRTQRLFAYLGQVERDRRAHEEWINNPQDPMYHSRR